MTDRYAFITGASSGIGAEFARQLGDMGYTLILTARRKDRLEHLRHDLAEADIKSQLHIADLSSIDDCRKLCESIEELPIDIFINNAGFGDCGPFSDTEVSTDMQMIDVNVKAMHFLKKKMLIKMEKQGHGSILNVASSAGLLPAGPYMAAYYATKAYVTSLTRAAAMEEKEKNGPVYIAALCPGPVDTEFNRVAHVKFALKGITTKYLVSYTLKQMKRGKTLIIPTLRIKLAVIMGRFIPQKLLIRLTGHQQKKKLY